MVQPSRAIQDRRLALPPPRCAGVGPWYAVLGESVMTCILVFTVLQTVCGKHRLDTGFAPIAIGFAVFLGHLVLIPIDGCSINPARALGPAIVANVWPSTFWIYVVSRRRGALPVLACLTLGLAGCSVWL